MAKVTLREVFERELILPYLEESPLTKAPLWQSGAFSQDGRLNALMASGSNVFKIPYLYGIDGNLEANYSNTILTDIAMPRGVKATSMIGRVAYMNEGFLESRLERYLSTVSPLEHIAKYINGMWLRQAELRAVATVVGLRNADSTDKKITIDKSAATATAASKFSYENWLDAEYSLDEKYRGNGVVFMHPEVIAYIRKIDATAIQTADATIYIDRPSDMPPLRTYNGRLIIETNEGTKVGTGANAKFVTILAGRDSFSAQMDRSYDDMELERTAATGNGGGHTTLWTRADTLIHPQGYSFVADESTLTGGTKNEAISASWSDLTKKENWEMVLDAKDIPFRFLVTNI